MDYRAKHQFVQILIALRFITKKKSYFVDRFWEIHAMTKAWMDNMFETFIPGRAYILVNIHAKMDQQI